MADENGVPASRNSPTPGNPERLSDNQRKIAEQAVLQPGRALNALARAEGIPVDKKFLAEWDAHESDIRAYISRELDRFGATIERAIKVISDGMGAQKIHVTRKGSVMETPDHNARRKAAELSLRLRGFLGSDNVQDLATRGIDVVSLLQAARDRGLIQDAEVVVESPKANGSPGKGPIRQGGPEAGAPGIPAF